MITKDTYFYKFEDGSSIWLAPDTKLPESYSNKDILSKELRVMLFPKEGKVLQNKETNEITNGIWLKDSSEEDYIEIDYPEEIEESTETEETQD